VEVVLDVHVRGVKIKKFLNPDVVTMHLLEKGFIERYLCWFAKENHMFLTRPW
jgi:hypothetical protein